MDSRKRRVRKRGTHARRLHTRRELFATEGCHCRTSVENTSCFATLRLSGGQSFPYQSADTFLLFERSRRNESSGFWCLIKRSEQKVWHEFCSSFCFALWLKRSFQLGTISGISVFRIRPQLPFASSPRALPSRRLSTLVLGKFARRPRSKTFSVSNNAAAPM